MNNLRHLIKALVREALSTYPPSSGKSLEDYEADVAPGSRRKHSDATELSTGLEVDTNLTAAAARNAVALKRFRDLGFAKTEMPPTVYCEVVGGYFGEWEVKDLVEKWSEEYEMAWDGYTVDEFVGWFMSNRIGDAPHDVPAYVNEWCSDWFGRLTDDQEFAIEILGSRLKTLAMQQD